MESITLLIVGWSITSILVNGTIFDRPRAYLQVKHPSLSKLLTCIQCSGFWVGVFLGLLTVIELIKNPMDTWFLMNYGLVTDFAICLAYGFLNSGISVVLDSLIVYLIKE